MSVPKTRGRRVLLPLSVALLFLLPQACDDPKKTGQVVIDDRMRSQGEAAGEVDSARGPSRGAERESDSARSPSQRAEREPRGSEPNGPMENLFEDGVKGWRGRAIPSYGGPGSAGPGGSGTIAEAGDPQGDQDGESEVVPLATFGPEVTVTFTSDNPDAASIEEAGLILFALLADEFDPEGRPLKESEGPVFQWVRASQSFQWPTSLQVHLPTSPDLRILAIVDVDGNGRLSYGDYLSQPVAVAEAAERKGAEVSFSIVRVLPSGPDSELGPNEEEFPGTSETPFPGGSTESASDGSGCG
jgi:hypothetical protein